MSFEEFFHKATGWFPYPYQQTLAQTADLPELLRIPTGAGKTEAAILAWLHRYFRHPDRAVRDSTPRRLVYCLPMRSLVEQTVDRIERWLSNLEMTGRIGLVTLMGGEPETQWYHSPERPFIVVGTQDMLLSRALNRGYGNSPFMWPVEYGMLNNDCLWVLDEVQLMSNGLPTSTQLAGLRHKLQTFGPAHSMWMSATVRADWLATVDHPAPSECLVLELGHDDLANPGMGKRHNARKVVSEAAVSGSNRASSMAEFVMRNHNAGALTLVIVNTVERAQEVYRQLNNRQFSLDAEKVLVHSRFREADRKEKQAAITADIDSSGPGMVVVATQAVEAGVDISAQTLITELAPWPSMVQRFGRCNRKGDADPGYVFWVDTGERGQDTAPYRPEDVAAARERMRSLEGRSVGPADLVLEGLDDVMGKADHPAVVRRRDVVGLFDTAPDLSGSYLDVSPYVRGTDERSVSVFWRDIPPEGPDPREPKPRHFETLNVPLGKNVDDYLKDERRRLWRWDFLDDEWVRPRQSEIHPGMVLMLDSKFGGYSQQTGWVPSSKEPVPPVQASDAKPVAEDGHGSDPGSTSLREQVTLSDHSGHVEAAVREVLDELAGWSIEPGIREAVELAALYHDAGKAHPAFQRMMQDLPEGAELPANEPPLAKSRTNRKNERRHFRHELGSALAVLEHAEGLEDMTRDLAAYLAAAHHGKVRLSIRSLPGRARGNGRSGNPDPEYLLGYSVSESDPDILPPVDLGAGRRIPATALEMSVAHIGLDNRGDRPSWLDRSTTLLDRLGPFRLAFLEAIVRAADMRASKEEQEAAR